MTIEAKIGSRVKQIREKAGITQLELAAKSKLDRTFITHVENGRRNVSVQSLEKILMGLDISFNKFFKKDLF